MKVRSKPAISHCIYPISSPIVRQERRILGRDTSSWVYHAVDCAQITQISIAWCNYVAFRELLTYVLSVVQIIINHNYYIVSRRTIHHEVVITQYLVYVCSRCHTMQLCGINQPTISVVCTSPGTPQALNSQDHCTELSQKLITLAQYKRPGVNWVFELSYHVSQYNVCTTTNTSVGSVGHQLRLWSIGQYR